MGSEGAAGLMGVAIVVFVLIVVAWGAYLTLKKEKKRDEPIVIVYPPCELTKEETLNIIAGKQDLCGNHVNWLNQQQGLPMMTMGDGNRAGESVKLIQFHRIYNYALNQGWIEDI